MGKWQDEAQQLAAEFYPEVRAAFGFLETGYGYQLVKEELGWPEDYRDTEAQVKYAGEHMGLRVFWYFSSGNVGVMFRTLQTPWQYPEQLSEEERRLHLPVFADLYSLARYLGTAQDPDFLLGDTWNVYESKCKKRDALIRSNLRGVLDGLAQATERYASDILRGDASQFAEAKAYSDVHRHDYWRQKKR